MDPIHPCPSSYPHMTLRIFMPWQDYDGFKNPMKPSINLTEKIIAAEYIWMGGSGMDMRSEARTPSGPDSDRGATTDPAGVRLQGTPVKSSYSGPQAVFKDPVRTGNNMLANLRDIRSLMAEEPWYSIE
ncbi:hypothetical protein OPV22_012214 [Ensete ventricosum]|uniref:Uncharacterized protein n=1 Tax=Ensete ventricosum TaxID=4639 RepID=A0AAV8PHA2_ENSVE|nr:hypothetical protein OPV22_012214 [Ensete ventricosum]